jgi:hypothetical protein
MAKRKVVEEPKVVVDWQKLAGDVIEISDLEKLNSIIAELDALKNKAVSRVATLKKDWVGCGVIMKNSTEEPEVNDRNNTRSRTVCASFTAGPNAASFSIIFTNVEDDESDETVVIESELFHIEDDNFFEVSNDRIEVFLNKAGLENVVSLNWDDDDEDEDGDDYGYGYLTDNEKEIIRKEKKLRRNRWVYGEVIEDAISLVINKYGHMDRYGLGLGMSEDDIYDHLGLRD